MNFTACRRDAAASIAASPRLRLLIHCRSFAASGGSIIVDRMAKQGTTGRSQPQPAAGPVRTGKPSSLLDTRVVYCGDNLEQLAKLPDGCVDLIYIDPPFNSNRNYEVFWGETKEKRSFEDRHASTQAYIDYMRPRCVELARVLKKTGSFYYHCDWHASHYVKVMLDVIFGQNNFQSGWGFPHHTPEAAPRRSLSGRRPRFCRFFSDSPYLLAHARGIVGSTSEVIYARSGHHALTRSGRA